MGVLITVIVIVVVVLVVRRARGRSNKMKTTDINATEIPAQEKYGIFYAAHTWIAMLVHS